MKIALLGAYPIIPFAEQLGITNPPQNSTSWNVNLANGLAAIPGNEVHFVTIVSGLKEDHIIRSNRVFIHFVSAPRKSRFLTLFQYNKVKIHRELAKIRPDIVHGHGTEHEYPYIAITSKFPNVVTFHNYMPLIIQEQGWGPLFIKSVPFFYEKYVLKKANYIISTTKFLNNKISKLTMAKRFIIDNPVSSSYFTENEKNPSQIIFIGYIRPEKGIDILVAAFNKIRQQYKDIRLNIIGPSSKLFSNYFLEISELCDSAVNDGQILLSGFKKSTQIAEELSRSYFLVLPSYHEPFGVVLIESLAMGTPVIASRVGGIPYIVEDGKTGILVEPGDVNALAEKMQLLLEDGELRQQMGQRGKQEAMKRFHLDVVAKKTMAVYEKVIADWKG